jgi:hypothetical protein
MIHRLIAPRITLIQAYAGVSIDAVKKQVAARFPALNIGPLQRRTG